MKLIQQVILPRTYDDLLRGGDQDKWARLVDYLKQLTIALSDDHREIANVISLNDDKLRVGLAAGKPAASEKVRNVVYITKGGAGVADTVEVCVKSAADTYSWVSMI